MKTNLEIQLERPRVITAVNWLHDALTHATMEENITLTVGKNKVPMSNQEWFAIYELLTAVKPA